MEALPPDWTARFDPDGKTYYVQTIDGVDSDPTWEHPDARPDMVALDLDLGIGDDEYHLLGLDGYAHLTDQHETQFHQHFDDLIAHEGTPIHAQQILGHLRRHSSIKLFQTPDTPQFDLGGMHTDLMAVDMPTTMRSSMGDLLKRGSFTDILAMVQDEVHTSMPDGLHQQQQDSFGGLIDMLGQPLPAMTMCAGMPAQIAGQYQLTAQDRATMEATFQAEVTGGAEPMAM